MALTSCSLVTDLSDLRGDASTFDAGDASGDVVVKSDAATTRYRRMITITTTTASVPAAYTIGVALDSNAILHAQPNLSDVRVLVDKTFVEIDRVADVTPPNELGEIWFALPASIGANAQATYWLDYGVSTATLTSATNVFAFYDDFSAPTLAPVWIENDASTAPTTGAGLTMPPPSEITTDYTADDVPVHSAVEVAATVSGGTQYWFGFQRQNDFVEGSPFLIWQTDSDPTTVYANSGDTCTTSCMGTRQPQSNVERWYRIERASQTTRYYIDNQLNFTANEVAVNDYSIKLKDGNAQIVVSFVRARVLVDPEPTVTLGSEVPAP